MWREGRDLRSLAFPPQAHFAELFKILAQIREMVSTVRQGDKGAADQGGFEHPASLAALGQQLAQVLGAKLAEGLPHQLPPPTGKRGATSKAAAAVKMHGGDAEDLAANYLPATSGAEGVFSRMPWHIAQVREG